MTGSKLDGENVDALTALQGGDIEPLIALLEDTGRPLHPELRRWLALMLKEGKPGAPRSRQAKYALKIKGSPGRKKTGFLEKAGELDWLGVGQFVHHSWHKGARITDAKHEAAEKLHLNERTIDALWDKYRRIYFLALEDGENLAPQLKPLRGQKVREK